jgi:hypothetical protein
VDISVIDKSDQCVSCCVHSLKDGSNWFHSFVYGANKPLDRRSLWQHLYTIKNRLFPNPWMLSGDFNVVEHLAEKWGSDSLNSYELEFGECLNDLEVIDLKFSGFFFTWNNKSEGAGFIARKLDRVLVNEEWLGRFGGTNVDFLSAGVSDHSPGLITVGSLVSFGPKPIKFCNFWLEHGDYMEWLSNCWMQEINGVPMYKLCRKLKEFKAILKSKTTSCFGNLRNKIIQACESLDLAQKAVIDSRGRADCLLKERECLHAYVSITKAEEAFLKQKARNQWLQLGDQNNAVFHRILKGRQVRNSISFLYDELGNKVEDIAQLKSMALEFYRNLLGSKNTHFTDASAERVKQLISPIVPIEEATLLERDVTAEEIKKTISSMKSNKAPGPDGYTAEFYKSSWHIVGGDVIEAIQNFFQNWASS